MTIKRFGIGLAPEGCGTDPNEGACENCVMWAVRRGRWAVRQLLPLTYRTRYRTVDGWDEDGQAILGPEWFVVWRMWLGRVFAYERVMIAA
jgi:hypothetical protein